MFWWPGANFGDSLSPMVVEALSGKPARYSSVFSNRPLGCQLVAIGSLLGDIPPCYRGGVWGTGFIAAGPVAELPNADVHALRGRLTARWLGVGSGVPLGDPAILAPEVLPEVRMHERHVLGIVPHFVDRSIVSSWRLAADDGVAIVDVRRSPQEVVAEIASCRHIVSSSLHGLIIADAFGIPNAWCRVSERLDGGGFKFEDYYSAYGRSCPDPLVLEGSEKVAEVVRSPRFSVNEVEKARRRLREAFPF
jgi:hypothetical protein